MTSKVAICNKALIKLGAETIASLTENSENSNTLLAIYDGVLDTELRKHPWNFAIKRVSLAADVDTPETDEYTTQYTLPTDLVRLLPGNSSSLDWKVEGRKIITNTTGAMYIRYVARITDTNEYDSAFVDVLAQALAVEMCERRTQSNQKAMTVREDYKFAVREAKKANAFENISDEFPEDTWITARL